MVPGRTGKPYPDRLEQRREAFGQRVQVATLDPFHGYKNAIDGQPRTPPPSLTPFVW